MTEENPRKRPRVDEHVLGLSARVRESIEENVIYDECGCTCTMDSKSDCFTHEALSNYLVLKNIFSHLDNNDLESCCQVNKCWNSVGDPTLVRYYDIKLKKSSQEYLSSYTAVITKRGTCNSEHVNYCSYTLDEARRLLDESVTTEKIAINLHIKISEYEEIKIVSNFLSKFGVLVEKLCADYYLNQRIFWKLIVHYFPNLKHLDLSETEFAADDHYFDGNLLENRMKHLRRIDNFRYIDKYLPVVTIFRMAPNLEEIHDFPIDMVDALVDTQKAGCVKSLVYPDNTRDDIFQTALEKLAALNVKLRSFSFEYLNSCLNESLSNIATQPFVLKMLQSSRDSLESLTLYRSETFDFNAITPMSSLQEVTFLLESENERCFNKFFSSDIVLRELFPNVSAMTILTTLDFYYISDIVSRFPENQFIPWGKQIESLKLIDVSLEVLQCLSKLFPAVKNLQFRVRGVKTNDLRVMLPAIGQFWPGMESLNIIVAYSFHSFNQVGDSQQCTFDSVFTGIPDRAIALLRDPLARENRFSVWEIESMKRASAIRKLSTLKILKFDLDSTSDYKFMEKLSAISSVSKEFGFQFLPEMKIVVRTYRDDQFQQVSDMKASLDAWVNFEVERLK